MRRLEQLGLALAHVNFSKSQHQHITVTLQAIEATGTWVPGLPRVDGNAKTML